VIAINAPKNIFDADFKNIIFFCSTSSLRYLYVLVISYLAYHRPMNRR